MPVILAAILSTRVEVKRQPDGVAVIADQRQGSYGCTLSRRERTGRSRGEKPIDVGVRAYRLRGIARLEGW